MEDSAATPRREIALADLAALERFELQISRLRRRLQNQVGGDASYLLLVVRERHVSAARRGVHERIEQLRAELE